MIASKIDSAHVVRAIALDTYEETPVLVLADIGGQALSELLADPIPVDQFLPVAIRLAEALGDIHRHGVVHKDIKPANIVVNTRTGHLNIIDFSIASMIPRELPSLDGTGGIEGTLAYLSPEQTGRMNRPIDYRTDFYSLGVTFYEMLTGRLPYAGRDLIEWIHCHIARAPQPPREVLPSIPEPVSAIVMKLLSKVAEERYQSANGLISDLKRCQAALQSGGLTSFSLGSADFSERFHPPQHLYGREQEVAALLKLFEESVRQPRPQIVLIGGYSGSGKSALVHELLKPIVRERAYFISGKFDQYRRDIPYATLVQALRNYAQQILAQSPERIAEWKQRVGQSLGENGRLITDVVPELGLILGEQPPVPELSPAEGQLRFQITVGHLLDAITTREHPLVLFLDDLQWADLASLQLLTFLLTQAAPRHLLLLCAYRDNEVTASHAFARAMDRVRAEGGAVQTLPVPSLPSRCIEALVADTLGASADSTRELSALIYEKTQGNPFFSRQFLSALHTDGLIEADREAGRWRWDLDRIKARNFTDNVIELMTARILRCSEDTQRALKTMAAIGNRVSLRLLAAALDLDSDKRVEAMVWEALRDGLIVRDGSGWQFVHDRIQQAAYTLLPEGERAAYHMCIGRLLHAKLNAREIEQHIFDIVNQINSDPQLADRSEHVVFAQLNLRAGNKAMASAAYAAAATYYSAGIALLPPDAWQTQYELSYTLHRLFAECEYLAGNHVRLEQLFETLLANARDNLDRGRVYKTRIDFHSTRGEMVRACEVAVECLSLLGEKLPAQPTMEEVGQEYATLFGHVAERSIDSLIDLPMATDPATLIIQTALAAATPCAFFSNPNLAALICARMINLAVKRGNTDAVCQGYTTIGLILTTMDKYEEAYRFGLVGKQLADRENIVAYKGRVGVMFTNIVSVWKKHLRECMGGTPSVHDLAMQAGDLTYACYAYNQAPLLRMTAGDPLEEVYGEAEKCLDFVRRAKYGEVADTLVTMQRYVRLLQGRSASATSFSGDDFDAEAFEQALAGKSMYANAWHYIPKMSALCIMGETQLARAAADKARAALPAVTGQLQLADYWFYDALITCDLLREKPTEEDKTQLLAQVREAEKKHVTLAQHCPANFENRLALIRAELFSLAGQGDEALPLYEHAVSSALLHGFVQNAAIALERASRHHRVRGLDRIANTYLRDAMLHYRRWGATGKVQQLVSAHPQIDLVADGRHDESVSLTRTTHSGGDTADLKTVLKASQAMAGEIDLSRLLPSLTRIMLENAGAQHAFLVVRSEAGLAVQTSLSVAATVSEAQLDLPVEQCGELVPSIVNFVANTGTPVLLDDATNSSYAGDASVRARRPKSVLCVPLAHQGRTRGVVYLENNSVTGAFTAARVELLKILSTQAAIALENATLYKEVQQHNESLEHEVTTRTTELRKTLADLWAEMDLAKKIQTVLLPTAPQVPGYEVAASMLPAHVVGGDYYDVFHCGNTDWVLIGDVSGHGVTAGLLMMMAHSAIRTATLLAQRNAELSPAEVVGLTNQSLFDSFKRVGRDQYMTMTAFRVDGDRFTFAGSHLDVLIYRQQTGKVERVETRGGWLGLFDDIKADLCNDSFTVGEGDIVLLYTDGVIESLREGGGLWGTEGLADALGALARAGASAGKIVDDIVGMLGRATVADDVTLLALRRNMKG